MENDTNKAAQEGNYSCPQGPGMDRQQIIINQHGVENSNGIGTAGFILALIALVLGVIPGVGWICWLLGLIFSCVGMARRPRGLATAGLVISIVGLILILALIGWSMEIIESFL